MADTFALRRLLPARLKQALRAARRRWPAPGPGLGRRAYRVPCVAVRQEGATLFVPRYARHRPAARAVLSGQVWEPQTRRLVTRLMEARRGDMVHAGAFFGDMLPHFASLSRRLYAFEPVLENYVLARLCTIRNDLSNVVLFHAGLSDVIGAGRVDTGGASGRHAGGGSKIAGTGQITTLVTIDAVVSTEVCVIQLDVEGHEAAVLRGAQETIRACAPFVLIEDNAGDCAPLLSALGYRKVGRTPHLFLWSPDGYAEMADAALRDAMDPAPAAG